MLNGLFIGLSVLFVISVIVFLVERLKECSVKATVLKATSSLFFVILACVAILIKPENADYGIMIFAPAPIPMYRGTLDPLSSSSSSEGIGGFSADARA